MTRSEQRQEVRDLFATGGAAYDARHYGVAYRTLIADRQRIVSRVVRTLPLAPEAKVLDVACGPGHMLADSASLGLLPMGLDMSMDMLRTARGRLSGNAVLAQGDALALPFRTSAFDAVNCSGLIEYVPNPLSLLREIMRVLKPGGHALVSSTNRLSPALVLEPMGNALRGSALVRRLIRALRLPFDDKALQPRRFTFHTPGRLASLLGQAGFAGIQMHYFHLQFVPHPFDRLAPHLATACVRLTDRALFIVPLRLLAEGLLGVAQRPAAVHTLAEC